ncbi:unnamed protein product, partial [Prorocentrum cordatum]
APSPAPPSAAAAPGAEPRGDLPELLRGRPLPEGLLGPARERLEGGLRSCVEGLYSDRVRPELPEVQRRLRGCGWSAREVLLRAPPAWFAGWVDPDARGELPPGVAQALCDLAALSEGFFKGGRRELASAMQRRGSECLQSRSLGELTHLAALALGSTGPLRYAPQHGGRIQRRPGGAPRGRGAALEPRVPAAAPLRAAAGAGAAPAPGGGGDAACGIEVAAAHAHSVGEVSPHELQLYSHLYMASEGTAASLQGFESVGQFEDSWMTIPCDPYDSVYSLAAVMFQPWAAAPLECVAHATDHQHGLPSFMGDVMGYSYVIGDDLKVG